MPSHPTHNAGGWPRSRLIMLVGSVTATAVALTAGLGLAVWYALAPTPTLAAAAAAAPDTDGVQGEAYRDQIAAQPMLQVPAAAASTPNIATELGPTITLPDATSVGAAGVARFPHTPEGAVAQLAAIEVTVAETMSIPVAHQIHTAWALPGGATAAEWAMTRNVQAFLSAIGDQGNIKDDTIYVSATPAAGQVKGVDGTDWVLACVLLDVNATIVTDARIGYGHCERMQWTDGRWMIAPGTPPATASSVWPGSDLALQAGWLTLTDG